MRSLAERAKKHDVEFFEAAPHRAPRRRLDEVTAARKPILRWHPTAKPEAAE
jgi:glycine dehydrogenase subunit 2